METQYESLVVLEIQNVLIQEINGNSQKVLQQGSLQVQVIKQYGLTFLKLNEFEYTLQKNIPVITQLVKSIDGVPLNMFVLPSADHLFYGIIIEQSQIELSHLFELIMADKCQLVQPSDQNIQLFVPQKDNLIDSTHQEILMKNSGVVLVQPEQVHEKIQAQSLGWLKAGPPQSNGQQNSTIPGKIVKVGDACKEGIMSGAKFISQGLISGGQYFQSKITHKETRHIDQSTIDRLNKVNSGSKAVYKYTKTQIELLVNLGRSIGDSAGNSIGQTEAGQAIKQNQIYKDVKEVGKSTIYVFASIYDGLFDALGVLGDGVALATTELVNAKYGEEAGLVSRQSFELAGSVGHLVRVHEDATIKAIIRDSKT